MALLLLGALTWPLLFTYSGFSGDWENHLWLMWHQSLSIRSGGVPSLFLSSAYSVFNPIYAFYAGTLYSAAGALALAFGTMQVYVLVFVLDFAAAFGGWYWLGRTVGLNRWLALVPGLIFITSTYYIAIVYVQGDWPAFTGISMIPLMVGAGLSMIRADRVRYPTALVLSLATALFFGSHILTMLLGLTTLTLTGLAIVAIVPAARRRLSGQSFARVARFAVPAAMVSAWYLLPAVVYASRTHVGSGYASSHQALRATVWLVALRRLFTFSRSSGIGLPVPYYLAVALPVLAIVWVLLAMLVLPAGNRNRAWTRLFLIFVGIGVLITLFMTHVGLLIALPGPYSLIQFSYRLDIYVVAMVCAAVLAGLVLVKTAPRRARVWTWAAIPVCAVSLGGAIQQLLDYPYPGQDRYVTLAYFGEVETGNNEDYHDTSQRRIPDTGLPKLDFPFESVHGGSVTATTSLRPGTLATTNIAAGSYLVKLTGAKSVGVGATSNDMVLEIGSAPAADSSGQRTVTVSAGNSLPIVLGRVLTVCGVALLALQLLLVPAWRLLTRRARPRGAV